MKKSLSLLLLAGLAVSGWLLSTQLSARPGSPDPGYVAHEWGTFTDVQGADGVQMVWNPGVAPDLPNFVYRSAFGLGLLKSSMATIQRMETPVIYFYSDRERTLDVAVNFPQGQITEWFPGKGAADPTAGMRALPSKKPALHWDKVKVLASSSAATTLPKDAQPTNYYAARETDASLLEVENVGKIEREKFLFYRGVAGFQAPLTVKMEPLPSTRVILQNTGAEPLRNLFLYQVTAKGGTWLNVPELAAGETRAVGLPETGGAPFSKLAPTLQAALVSEGLYEREAAAMVKTWQAAWFEERGLRVLYTLPRKWTDRTLPLQLTPAAHRIERVMVARAEIISPAMEQALASSMDRYLAAPSTARRDVAVAEIREMGLGRFLPSAMQRIMKPELTPEVRQSYWEVVGAVLAPKPAVVARS